MKTNLKQTLILLIAGVLVIGGVLFAGDLLPTTETPEATYVSLEDIYEKLTTGATTTEKSFTPTVGTDTATMHTLSEIFDLIYATSTLVAVEPNLVEDNIVSGISIFGITGTASAGGGGGVELRTGQTWCYDASAHQTCPVTGFPRQDADINEATEKSFTDNGDGTVTDTQTGIMWTKVDNGPTLTWANALIYCNGLSTGGYTNWHLPNFVEMATLIDFGPSGYKNAAFTWSGDYYWTSTSRPSWPGVAYTAGFGIGTISYGGKSDVVTFVARCAR